jgi:integrase
MFYFRMTRNGRCYYRSLGPNLVEARRRAQLLKQEFAQAAELTLEPETLPEKTVRSFSRRWLTEYVAQRRVGKGRALAKQRLEDYVLPIVGSLTLPEVTTPHLRAVRGRCEKAKLSPQTVRHVLGDVRCLLRYGIECGLTTTVPSFRTVFPTVSEVAPRRLSDEEMAAILGSLTERQAFVVRLALLTGLRWGELRRLQWRHVIANPTPHLIVELTKSRKVRRVPLVPEAAALLKAAKAKTSSVNVLPYRMKKPCSLYANGEEKSGVKWHFHQLRHTFACRWLEAGGSKEALQRILGHSTIRLTERYGALGDEAVFSEAERVGRRISGRITPDCVAERESANLLRPNL